MMETTFGFRKDRLDQALGFIADRGNGCLWNEISVARHPMGCLLILQVSAT